MAIKTKTSCYFPLIALDIKIEKTEVKEASGVQYILLSLIKNAQAGKQRQDELLCNVLENFGVPKDLLPMFSKEMKYLIRENILNANADYEPWIEEEATIGDFEFTELGEKLFRDKAIPTNHKTQLQKRVYFDPVNNQFTFGGGYDIAKNGMETCSIKGININPEDFRLDGVKDFIEEHKDRIGIKVQEKVVAVIVDKTELVPYKAEDCLALDIDIAGARFAFTEEYANFVKQYFTGELLSEVLISKSKFQFPKGTEAESIQSLTEIPDASNVFLPSAMPGIISKTADLAFDIPYKTVFENNQATSYIPVSVQMHDLAYGFNVTIPLWVDRTLSEPEYDIMLKDICKHFRQEAFSGKNLFSLAVATKLLKNEEYLNDYITENIVVEKNFNKKLTNFKIANETLKGNELIIRTANDLFQKVKGEITVDNLGFYKQGLVTVKSIIGLTDEQFAEALISNIKGNLNPESLFTVMTSAGFSEDEALPYANVVKDYLTKVLAGKQLTDINKLAHRFIVIGNKLSELKQLLGVKDTKNYKVNDDYSAKDVEGAFRVFKDEFDRMKRHHGFAEKEFIELSKYYEIFQRIYDFIIMENNATKSPKSTTRQMLEQKLNNGRLQDAIVNTAVKLEWVLGEKGYKGDFIDRINESADDGVITLNEKNEFHLLRNARNDFSHGLTEGVKYNPADVRKWIELVFETEKR